MKILVHGAAGHMGQILCQMIREGKQNATLAGMVDAHPTGDMLPSLDAFRDDADCIIDFSNHACTEALTGYAVKRKLPLVIATTGHTPGEVEMIRAAAREIPVFFAANMSLGIAALCRLAKAAARMFPDADIEIVEQHHNRKLDVPSGTALMLGRALQEVRSDAALLVGRHENGRRTRQEIGIHSLRMGNIVGIHEVIINTGSEILSLKHEAQDRGLFADGALTAAAFLAGKAPGLYDMNHIAAE